jgi:hypothetical protein
MSVTNANVVDATGVDKSSGEIVLTVADELDWAAEAQHLLQLQKKINRYLDFVEGGELLSTYPDARSRAVRIDVIFKYSPSLAAQSFLSKAETAVRENGCSLSWRVLSV